MEIDPAADRAYYRQMADILRGRITSGELPAGSMLPSAGSLARQYRTGTDTARRALAVLRAEGLIVTVPREGSYVREHQPAEIVTVTSGRVSARMPSPDERRELHLAEGVPVLVVETPEGVRLLAADRVVLDVCAGRSP